MQPHPTRKAVTKNEMMEEQQMSELNNTEPVSSEISQATEPDAPSQGVLAKDPADSFDGSVKGYHNKTARLLNIVYLSMLAISVLYICFQCYLTITGYLQQAAPLSLAIMYTLSGLLMPAILVVSIAFLFKFFAEVVELMHKNSK